jgi:predicted O-methyltransferase YrrM
VARHWRTPCALVFVDGGHGAAPARADYDGWAPHVAPGGVLAVHDVFPDPADGGRPPYEEIYRPALASGRFEEIGATGSLRVLRRRGGA